MMDGHVLETPILINGVLSTILIIYPTLNVQDSSTSTSVIK
jgi:hypothetical protein